MTKILKHNDDGTRTTYEGVVSSSGAADAGEFPVLDGQGKLDSSVLPNGVGADAVSATAGEDLNSGDFVYFNSIGNVLKADATAIGKQARGYVIAGVTNGSQATVYFDDTNGVLTGLTPGATYYLSPTTPGAVTETAPTLSTQIVQRLGFASNATTLHTDIEQPVILS